MGGKYTMISSPGKSLLHNHKSQPLHQDLNKEPLLLPFTSMIKQVRPIGRSRGHHREAIVSYVVPSELAKYQSHEEGYWNTFVLFYHTISLTLLLFCQKRKDEMDGCPWWLFGRHDNRYVAVTKQVLIKVTVRVSSWQVCPAQANHNMV